VALACAVTLGACAGTPPPQSGRVILQQTGGAVEVTRAVPSLEDLEASVGIVRNAARVPVAGPTTELGSEAAEITGDEVPVQTERDRRLLALSVRLGTDEVTELVERQAGAVAELDGLGWEQLSATREARYRRAVTSASEARRLSALGRLDAALGRAISSADVIAALRPAALARTMVVDAEVALRREPGGDPYTAQERERAERLLIGAREALGRGDARRAMQRAYYACLLLGVAV